MENPWAPFEDIWRQKLLRGEQVDFTVDTPDRAIFEKMGEEWLKTKEILKHSAPLPHQGDFATCKVVILLAQVRHTNGTGYDPVNFSPNELNLYFSNLLQRPLIAGEPIQGFSMSPDRDWWRKKLDPLISAMIERGKTPEEARKLLQDRMALLQVHAYSTSKFAHKEQKCEPPVLKKNPTMDYSLELAKKALERGAIVLWLLRPKHWDEALGLSNKPHLKVLRAKRSFGGSFSLKKDNMDTKTSNITYDDLLDALCDQPGAPPASKSRTKKRKRPMARPEVELDKKSKVTAKASGNKVMVVLDIEDECGICLEAWDPLTRKPGMLLCGHNNFCTTCAEEHFQNALQLEASEKPVYTCPLGCELADKAVIPIRIKISKSD